MGASVGGVGAAGVWVDVKIPYRSLTFSPDLIFQGQKNVSQSIRLPAPYNGL